MRHSSEAVSDVQYIDDRDDLWSFTPGQGSNEWDVYDTNNAIYFDNTLTFDCTYGPTYTASYVINGN